MKTNCLNVILMLLLFSSCSSPVQYNDPIPVHDTFTIASKEVSETRTINVWTPPTYKVGTDSLTVLYMPDGGVKEDFPHIANTIAALIEAKKIKPIILVGIENTQRRKDLTGYTEVAKDKEIAPVVGGADQFRDFISNELVPEITTRYRTNGEKGIIGESLAGLFVTETLLLHPNIFDFYIAFDPSLWWNDQSLIKTAPSHLSKFSDLTTKKFWFAGSDAEDIAPHVAKLSQTLSANKNTNVLWKFSNEPNEKHNTIFRATKEKALIWTVGSAQ